MNRQFLSMAGYTNYKLCAARIVRLARWVVIAVAAAMAACTAPPPDVLPTLAVLPSATLAAIVPSPAATSAAQAASAEPATAAPTATVEPSPTTLAPTVAPTTPPPAATASPSGTPTATATITLTPSLTITNTVTPIPSPTYTASPELGLLGDLAALADRATILPPERLYNPPTLTALFFAEQSYAATQGAATIQAGLPTPIGGAPVAGGCLIAPPAMLAAETSLGCPLTGAPFPTVTGVQPFERGTMIFVQGPPNHIYVLTPDGRFRRYDDTWAAGVDPETQPDAPPPGLVTPKRGFGKVWAAFPDVRGQLGFATADESGSTGAQQMFERGRAIGVAVRGEIVVLSDDPGSGGQAGTWRIIAGAL